MFIMLLSYLQPIDKIEKYLSQHINYLDKYYGSGHFIASGRKEPRTGGVILCRADNKEEVIAIMKEDPFYIHQIAHYDIIEFMPTKYANGFDKFI